MSRAHRPPASGTPPRFKPPAVTQRKAATALSFDDFDHFRLHPDLLRGVRDLEFVKPTPIQNEAIPPILAGKDVLGRAMTGSGKTAAFVLPILHRLLAKPRGTTRALILTPA